MYALSVSAEGDCYRCVPPDPRIAAAALSASESGTLPGTAPAEALHTFMLDSGASRRFFRDSTTLTPLPAPVSVRLADPSGGLVVARSSTVLSCLAVPSGSLSGLHLPWFSTNLGRHLATFTRRPGSSLYTLATVPPQEAASAHVSTSSQVAPPCSYRLLSHQTLLWHNRLGHPSLPRLCGMHSCLLVSGLPRSLPPPPPSPAQPCLPCVEGRKHATPHFSSFPPTTTTQQTLHMDVWGPARVSRQGRERYFLLVVDDYTRYTTVFPLRSKGEVVDVLIPWIRAVRLQLRERHGGRSYLHDPCGRSPFSVAVCGPVRCASGQPLAPCLLAGDLAYIALDGEGWRCVSDPSLEFSFFVRDTSADKLSARAILCIFPGLVPDAIGWQFYHPTSRRVLPSQDVTFDESIPFCRLFPYCSAPLPPPPLFLAPGPPPVDPLPFQGPAPSGVSQLDPPPGAVPGEVALDSGAARGTASGGAGPGGAEPGGAKTGGAEPGGAESEGVEPRGAESEGEGSGGDEPQGAASSGGSAGSSPRLSPQQLHEWLVRRAILQSGVTGAGGAGDAAGACFPGGTATSGPGDARSRGNGDAGTSGDGGTGAGDPMESGAAGAGGSGAGGTGAR
ncbi:unnamed protein product [Closterium sp. NIES-54]